MSAPTGALTRLVPLLRCPACAGDLEPVTNQGVMDGREGVDGASAPDPGVRLGGVRCRSGHVFDRARQGYLTLFGPKGRRFPGDTTEQVLARERVLGSGLFDPVAAMLADIACAVVAEQVDAGSTDSGPVGEHLRTGSTDSGPVVLEAGAGTGFYLARVLAGLRAAAGPGAPAPGAAPLGVGTEISVAAARRLARSDPDAAALICDTWEALPLADASVDLVQVVFAPRNPAEFARLIRPGGTLVVAGPGPGHLEPLRTVAGMLAPAGGKADRLGAEFARDFIPGRLHEVDVRLPVGADLAVELALMGPSGVHLSRSEVEEAVGGRDREVRVHVEARTFRRIRGPVQARSDA